MGVVAAFINYFGQKAGGHDWTLSGAVHLQHWSESHYGEILGFIMFAVLCAYMIWDTLRER